MKRVVIELPVGRVEVEDHGTYLFLVEQGTLRDLSELAIYTTALERIIAETGVSKAVIDARAEVGDPPEAVRTAMWAWLTGGGRGFSMVAFVLPTEMAMARVNMTALSRGVNVRAFDSVFSAQRWLVRGGRRSTAATLPAMRPPSSPPPPRKDDSTTTTRKDESTTTPTFVAGRYHVTSGREERITGAHAAVPRREPEARADDRAKGRREKRASDFHTKPGLEKKKDDDDGSRGVA